MTDQPTTTPAPAEHAGPPQFFDAATWANIPHGSRACLYKDGEDEVPPDAPQQLALESWHGITVTGDPAWLIDDWEPGNPGFTPWALRRFVRGRRAERKRAVLYVQRNLAREALDVLGYAASLDLASYPIWWIPTLDDHQWTAAELAADLADNWDAPIPAALIWANQWTQNPQLGPAAKNDQSSLFGDWERK